MNAKAVPSVLVIEDDGLAREALVTILSRVGYAAFEAENGQAALERLRTTIRPPDLILLDLMMPKLSGIEVCRLLRDNDATADTPVILFTAKAQEADVQRGFSAGADDYIVKPFSPRELITRVQAVLARARSH